MAAIVTYERVTHQEAVVKVSGLPADTATIVLSTDLFPQGGIELRTGTIECDDSSPIVTGTGTNWTNSLVGGKIYSGVTRALLGTVLSVEGTGSLTLTANAADNADGDTYGTSYKSQLLNGDVQTVPIVGVLHTGTGVATITRNSVVTMTLNGAASNGYIDLGGNSMPADVQNETSDIVVSFSGASSVSQVWLKLRKVHGYKTTVETATFGIYDDETAAES